MENKKCLKCGKQKTAEEFCWKYKKEGVRHSNCRECTREVTKAHYQKNKDAYKKRAVEFTRKKSKNHRSEILEYLKKHHCVDCGENDPVVLQFDHVSGIKKDAVSTMSYSSYKWKTIETEIAKCEVRCANCHLRRHYKEKTGVWLNKEDKMRVRGSIG